MARTQYISEEAPNSVLCDLDGNGDPDGVMDGLRVTGDLSDNLSLHCRKLVRGLGKLRCEWTPFFSEEQHEQSFGGQRFASGVRCRGDYCDDISFYACSVTE